MEKRLPTLEDVNDVAPGTPIFFLHLYDRAQLNAAALRVVIDTRDTPNPPGAEIVRDAAGTPTAAARYARAMRHPPRQSHD